MLERVVSGGQTGADQAALRAARAAGIPTGGFAPLGWRTEAGAAPWLADYGLVEHDSPDYPPRTVANVRAADAVLIFGDLTSAGSKLTVKACREAGKSWVHVQSGVSMPSHVVEFLRNNSRVKTLMVAGNRESKSPGIGGRVERFLGDVFKRIARGG